MPPRIPFDAWHWLVNPSRDTQAPCMAEKAYQETVARSRYEACGKAQRTVSSAKPKHPVTWLLVSAPSNAE